MEQFQQTSPLPQIGKQPEGQVVYAPIIQQESPLSQTAKSPTVMEANGIDFATAVMSTLDDKKITKKEWGNEKIYGYLKDTMLVLHKEDGRDYSWIITDGDLLGKDWMIL